MNHLLNPLCVHIFAPIIMILNTCSAHWNLIADSFWMERFSIIIFIIRTKITLEILHWWSRMRFIKWLFSYLILIRVRFLLTFGSECIFITFSFCGMLQFFSFSIEVSLIKMDFKIYSIFSSFNSLIHLNNFTLMTCLITLFNS